MQTEVTKGTKAVTKKEKAGTLALPEELQGSWGTEEVTAEDVIIPKLLLMHGQSELVMDGKKIQGDIIRSTDHKTLGGKETKVKVIPFMMYKTWVESELVGNKYEWRREVPLTPDNSDQDWEFTENGASWRRDWTYNFYALLVNDLEEGTARLPIRLQFKRTSRKAGKQIASFFSECKMDNKPPAIRNWEIYSELIKGEENNYYVFRVDMGEQTKVEHMLVAKQWYTNIMKDRDKFKDHQVEEEATGGEGLTTETEY